MQFRYGRNSNPRSYSWKKTGQNETRKNQGCKRMENPNEDQGCRKFPWICKFLQILYPKLQPHSKTVEQTKRQERIRMEQRSPTSIQRIERQNNQPTSTLSFKERRKIQSRNRFFRTCNKRSTIPGTRWEMEINSISIKNNTTSRKKL